MRPTAPLLLSLVPLLLSLGISNAIAAPAGKQQQTVLMQGKPAGGQTVDTAADGSTRVEYQFKDRGRGDHTKTRWSLDAAGVPVEFNAEGNNYLQVPVHERFSLKNGKASWKNDSENGEKTLSAPAFYLPLNAPPEMQGVLARALLKAPGHTLALLPAGEARLEAAGTFEATTKNGPATLSLYRISGLDYTPGSVWLDAQGNTAALIMASGWVSVIAPEYLDALPKLIEFQERAAAQWSLKLARDLAHTPKGPLLIRNARLYDPRDLSVTPNTSVLIENERIVRVASDSAIKAPADAEVFDAGNRFLMPGLWDVHKHYSDADGALDIANGITSARDVANNTDAFLEKVKRFDAGTEIGPRVLYAGFIDGPGPYAGPTKMLVATPAEAIKAVDWYADHGYMQIKSYSSLKPELVPVIADRAHARGLRYSGHVPAYMSARQFIEGGADELQHLLFVELNFMYPRVQETHTMKRLTEVAAHAAEFPPEKPEVREFIEFLKRHHTVLDPTMGIGEDLFAGNPADKVPPGLKTVAARLPPQAQRNLSWGALKAPKGEEHAYAQSFPAMMRLLKALYDAGVTIMPGTDALAGYMLHSELAIYSRAGIPNAEVLRMATLTPSQVLGVDKDRGVIAPGKLADLVLIDGDPIRDMEDIRKVDAVFKGGKRYDPGQIERALGIEPRKAAAD
ncbi:amidohydrolase family protein [Lysobacter capsici]|uniref:amidohydrolase family protein n=1 Tax=Lysobacter capsici TaxID=435897 RepID=UPI001C006EDD|nr:amidohydrolase family protein [Lysobacter capsici]QWF16020.1 amidohydrolase family protein [Lysobacter capsici]